MKTATLVVVLALAACTHPDDVQVSAGAGPARAEATAQHVLSLYPAMQPDASEGEVYDYH